jgi:hypothetical protein
VGSVPAWASLAPWTGLIWFLAATIRYARPDGRGAPEVRIGWPNRGSMLTYLGWVVLTATLVLA